MQSVKSRPTQIMQVFPPEFEETTAEDEQTQCKQSPLVWKRANMQNVGWVHENWIQWWKSFPVEYTRRAR